MTGRSRLTAVPPVTARELPPDLRDAVKVAISDMTWLHPSDKALAALAQRIAAEIETSIDRARDIATLLRDAALEDVSLYKRVEKLEAQCNAMKAVGWLGPQLQAALRDLGGTPAAREAMKADKPIGGRLAQIRKDAAARQDDA